ncbi:MAG: TonB-dependent receptor [Bryobacterales bacterium]|nr:TonB-dependent receptor [Bryobacterales bacterium]
MLRSRTAALLLALLCASAAAPAATPQKSEPEPSKPAPESTPPPQRTDLNLLGKTNAQNGESRRNENVQFNLIDNNALKELNTRTGTTATLFPEFRSDRSYFGGEFGVAPSAAVHIAPAKPAPWHGSLFFTHGNSVFNARSFFTVGELKPAHENQYGATVTFRLAPSTHATFDGSQNRVRGFVNGNVLVPRADERTPRIADPARRALIQRFLDGFPAELPNRTDINERALNTNAPQALNDNNASLRLDHQLTTRDSLFARYHFTSQFVDAFQLVAGQNPDTTTKANTATLTWNRNWTAQTVTQTSAAFDRVTSLLVPEPNAVGPQVNFSNVITTLGPGSSIPIDRAQNRYRLSASLQQARGAHNWYAGGELVRRQVNGFEASSHRGNLYFRNDFGRDVMTNFLLGIPSRFSGATGNATRAFRTWEPFLFLGDQWRATPWLQLSYGLRWEFAGAPTEANRLTPVPYPSDRNNLAPRLGLAFQLPGRAGALRAVYGLHYSEIFPVTYGQTRYNPPLNQKFEIQVPDLLLPFQQLNIPVDPTARSTFVDVDTRLRSPYVHHYNLIWEPRLSRHLRLQLGYLGSRSNKLLFMWFTNRAVPVPGVPQTTATINARRPNPLYFDHRRIVNGSRGYFDAGRATLVMPGFHGFSWDASYWWSKALDLGGYYTSPGAGDDGRQGLAQSEFFVWSDMRGPSVFDQRHAFLLRANYSPPRLAAAPASPASPPTGSSPPSPSSKPEPPSPSSAAPTPPASATSTATRATAPTSSTPPSSAAPPATPTPPAPCSPPPPSPTSPPPTSAATSAPTPSAKPASATSTSPSNAPSPSPPTSASTSAPKPSTPSTPPNSPSPGANSPAPASASSPTPSTTAAPSVFR